MLNETLLVILGVICLIFGASFTIIAIKFRSLRGTVRVSIREMVALLVLISQYKNLEHSEEKLSLLLKMDRDQLRQEMEKGNLMCLIMAKATGILETLKASVPEARAMIGPVEQSIDYDEDVPPAVCWGLHDTFVEER